MFYIHVCEPQPLYNTIVGVQVNFPASYPNHAVLRVKCIGILQSPSYKTIWGPALIRVINIQNSVITKNVIKRLRCSWTLFQKS